MTNLELQEHQAAQEMVDYLAMLVLAIKCVERMLVRLGVGRAA